MMADQTGTYLDELPEDFRAQLPPAWEDVQDKYQAAFPGLTPDYIKSRYEQHRQFAIARQIAAATPTDTRDWLARRAVPFASTAINVGATTGYADAIKRLQEGQPRSTDYQTIADYEERQARDQQQNETLGGALL